MSPPPADLLARVATAVGPDWPRVQAVARVAASRGEALWLVGGAVRDLLLGRGIKDVDLVVEGDAVALAGAVVAAHGGTVVRHGAFGTAKWVPEVEGEALDLATARTETYSAPASLPVVAPADIRADLGRRDFSINAMAIGLSGAAGGVLLDPFGGQADLEAGLLRVLHDRSFVDDPTRALRAARFAGRFRFLTEDHTLELAFDASESGAFAALGLERFGMELERLLREPEPWRCLVPIVAKLAIYGRDPRPVRGSMQEEALLGLASERLREVRGWAPDAAPDPVGVYWKILGASVDPAVRAACVRMVPGGKAAQARYLAGLDDAAAAARALQGAARGAAGHVLRRLDPAAAVAALLVRAPLDPALLSWWLREGRSVRLALDGRDLIAAGVAPGPGLGRALEAAWSAAWEGGDAAAQRRAALGAQPLPD
jgi:tRNA nucleotidyltransferase (CCA-adding enzyme)